MTNRSPSADHHFPARRNAEGKHLCRWCGEVLTGRRTSYCNEECYREIAIRISPGTARRNVFKRDHGVCSRCGEDTQSVEEAKEWMQERLASPAGARNRHRQSLRALIQKLFWECRIADRIPRFQWEVHHIIPVAEGGLMLGLENLQTVCCRCHPKLTGRLRRRLHARKKGLVPLLEAEAEEMRDVEGGGAGMFPADAVGRRAAVIRCGVCRAEPGLAPLCCE